jgi:hypothetical protein
MMADFNEALETASNTILKRNLSDDERVEFLELGAALGIETVKDYLYMLMIFKRNEDRLNTRFDEMGVLEKKIHDTLESSIERVLSDGAREIGQNMGAHIAMGAKDVLGAHEEFHFFRGQTWIVCLITLLTTLAYWFGTLNLLRVDDLNPLKTILMLPAGGVALFCGSSYTLFWVMDRWGLVKEYISYKVLLALQGLVLLALLVQLL